MNVWIAEEAAVTDWRSRLRGRPEKDQKSTDDVSYLDCRNACSYFDVKSTALDTTRTTTVADLIFQYCGERSRLYTKEELQGAYPQLGKDYQPSAYVQRLAAETPTLSLLRSLGSSGWEKTKRFSPETVVEAALREGDVLLLRRTSPQEIVRSDVQCGGGGRYYLRGGGGAAHVRMVRDAGEFHNLVQESNQSELRLNAGLHTASWRHKVVLLYTADDVQVASYLRTHVDALDRMSGHDCDVFFIENPSATNPFRFWRPLLTEKLYVAWKLLGWADSVPYDKSEAYDVARKLRVPFDAMPCACILSADGRGATEVVPFGSDLTLDFRRLFDRFSGPSALPSHSDRRPTCFLSHSSVDKRLVREVAVMLHSLGIETWFDEWQMRAGDSVIGKIQEGLASAESIVIFLSSRSLESPWLNAELEAALHEQIASKKYDAIIPVVLDGCELPILLRNYCRIEGGTDPAQIAEQIRRAIRRQETNPAVLTPISR